MYSGGAGGARAPPEFRGSEKGQSLISAYRTLAITMNTTIYGAERGSIHMFDDVEAGVKKSHH